MQRVHARRILIVSPALVRENWKREVERTLKLTPGVIRWGRERKLSVQEDVQRCVQYSMDIQIVSYDLLGHVDVQWDGIILDEAHCLRNPLSQQSKRIWALLQMNPQAHCIALTATLIPKEPRQVFGLVDSLRPGFFGKRSKVGDVGWHFLNKYCNKEVNAYGIMYRGLKKENAHVLEKKLLEVSHRVTGRDFAKYMPPLHVEPLHTDACGPGYIDMALQWVATRVDEIAHIGVYTHLRETAYMIAEQLARAHRNVLCITGKDSAKVRDDYLETARDSDNSIIVGTTHALNQGVSLSFQKAALVVEWTTSPSEVIQFIGRFARQDSASDAPTTINFIVGPNDVGRSGRLLGRISDINRLLAPGLNEDNAQKAFAPTEQTEAEFEASVAQLIKGVGRRSLLWSADDDHEDDDE